MATITTTGNTGSAVSRAADQQAQRPKPKTSRPPTSPAARADQQRRQAGRAAYKQPVNMGLPDPIVSATKKALLGSGDKVDTRG